MDLEFNDSIIPPSGIITSTDNVSTNVMINGSFSSQAQNIEISPIINASQGVNSGMSSAAQAREISYYRNFPKLSANNKSPLFIGFDEDLFTPMNIQETSNITSDFNETKNEVIIIEPQSTEQLRSFFNNDLKLAKSLRDSIIGSVGIINIRKNISRKLLIIEIDHCNNDKIQEILNLSLLGDYQIKCRLPLNKTISYGVIGPIGIETSLVELKDELISQELNIDKITRIYKGKEKTPTVFTKVAFISENLPDFVKIGYQRFRVRQYVGTPWQCYRCQGFGHSAPHCRYKPRCLVCSGAHELRECDQRKNNGRADIVKCPNCQGAHTANYGGCPSYQKAKVIEKIRVEQKLSYRDAAKFHVSSIKNNMSVTSKNSNFATINSNSHASNEKSTSFRDNVQISNSTNPPVQPKITTTIATQTECSNTVNNIYSVGTQSVPEQINNNLELFKGIAKIIHDLLNIGKTKSIPYSKIIESVNETFGTSLKNVNTDVDDIFERSRPHSQSDESINETQMSKKRKKVAGSKTNKKHNK